MIFQFFTNTLQDRIKYPYGLMNSRNCGPGYSNASHCRERHSIRYQDSLDNVNQADVYFGMDLEVLASREFMKQQTLLKITRFVSATYFLKCSSGNYEEFRHRAFYRS